MTDAGPSGAATRTPRGRRRWLAAGVAAVALVVYLGVLVLYASSTRLDVATDQLDIRPAEDAIVLDTTDLTADEVFAQAIGIVRSRSS